MTISSPKHWFRAATCLAFLLVGVPAARALTVTPRFITPTPTTARTAEPRVQLGAGNSEPTGPTRIDVQLFDQPATLANLEQRIAFGPSAPVMAKEDGSPDCTLRTTLEGDFAFVPDGCDPTADCTTLLATIHGLENNTGNSLLFSCMFDIVDPAAFETCQEPLLCGTNLATNSLGVEIPISCGDGVLSSRFPDADVTFAIATDPPPEVGQVFHLTVTPSLHNDADVGQVDFSLVAAMPAAFDGPLIADPIPSLGPVVFDLTATRAGLTQVIVRMDYQTTGGCPGHETDETRVLFSPPFSFEIAEAQPTPTPVPAGGGCQSSPQGAGAVLPIAVWLFLLRRKRPPVG